jgi:hypothetical protein
LLEIFKYLKVFSVTLRRSAIYNPDLPYGFSWVRIHGDGDFLAVGGPTRGTVILPRKTVMLLNYGNDILIKVWAIL